MSQGLSAHRAAILHCLSSPEAGRGADACEYLEDGILLVEDGHVAAIGPAAELLARYPRLSVQQHRHALLTPGFIDTHIHYPQTGMIASHGEQLLDWLETYTFPCERRFEDALHAREVAELFIAELLRNGTTSALVFGSVHPQSVDALFEAASTRNLRLIAGKVLMDRNAPDYLTDSAESGYQQSKALIERWHGSSAR